MTDDQFSNDDDTVTETPNPKDLRAQLEKRNKEFADLQAEVKKMTEANRKRDLADALDGLGLDRGAVALLPQDVVDADGAKAWVEANASYLNLGRKTEEKPAQGAPAVQNTDNGSDAVDDFLNSLGDSDRASTGSAPAGGSFEDKAKQIFGSAKPGESVEDLYARLLGQ